MWEGEHRRWVGAPPRARTECAMTFNEGMQIDTSTTSSSGGGRGGGRGIAVGGGIGGLLIVVVALFLGVDPGTVLPEQQQIGTEGVQAPGFDLSQCKTGADANEFVQCRVVATGNSLDAVWSQLKPDYTRPQVEIFSGSVDTRCGPATSAVGPFYCPADQTAYFDTDFFDVLRDQFGSSGGPFAQEYVVAHEFGHHVQQLQGSLARAQEDPEGPTGGGVRTELQADCYAGVWAHYAAVTTQESTGVPFLEPLTDKDIADALSAASAVGDDRIQEAATGRVNPESWTHGSSEQRQKWFTVGYQTGDPTKCDTFATNDLG
ncbi:membrane protein [Mycolicibacterium monacense DSM 44395]|nr:membrane protein [Mycolicibacterium monacense DSM 44395]